MFKALLLLPLLFSNIVSANMNFLKDFSLRSLEVENFSKRLTEKVFSSNEWPRNFNYQDRNYVVDYTLDSDLESYIKKELRRYSSDYASVVVMNNNTGEILSAIDYTRAIKSYGKNLTFSATNPAASIFKVVTGADLIENHDLTSESPFTYIGKGTTLYKYQLKDKKTRWMRKTNLSRAFASSNNVVFGKAAKNFSSFDSLTQTARKFGFQKNLLQFLDMGQSRLFDRNTSYGLAELASGFNKGTMMSPVHGAVIASIIANGGVLKSPYLIKQIKQKDHNRVVWSPSQNISQAISSESAAEMRNLMELTVTKGTARGAFRRSLRRKLASIEVGGKTGTLTGGVPYGRRDWFVSYAMPKDGADKGISVCVMIINLEKWYIKSSALAKNIIEYYYSRN